MHVFVCASVVELVHMCADTGGDQKKAVDPLELELELRREAHSVGAGIQVSLPKEQYMLLSTESSPQPHMNEFLPAVRLPLGARRT